MQGAGVASAITKSAVVATGIGLGVAAGANAGLKYEERRVHRFEQDRIAEAAGTLAPGAAGPWRVEHDVPIEADEHGEVAVVRTVGNAAIECKEIVFSVDMAEGHEPRRAFYTATVCHDGPHWKWATAEPGNGALGIAAVRLAVLLVGLALGGCSSAGNIIGLVTGAAAGGASANPVVGFGVGAATAALSDYAIKRVARTWHRGEQDAIAEAASGLAPGGTGPWRVRHSLPLGNEHGALQVVRAIPNPLAPCKQVLFSVEDEGDRPAWYSVDICQQQDRWKWASAEPAVERWGFLQ